MAKLNGDSSLAVNLIAQGTTVKGDIQTEGDFRIDGKLHGSIQSSGKIIVGETGYVEGEIICQNADISGKIKANVKTSKLLSLKATAQVAGEVMTAKLSIEEGAIFTANCQMEGNAAHDRKQKDNTRPTETGQSK